MNRRNFIATLVGTAAAMATPSAAMIETVETQKIARILDSFPKVRGSSSIFLSSRIKDDGGLSFEMYKKGDDEKFEITDDMMNASVETTEIKVDDDAIKILFEMVRGANRVAKKTNRARGNHYCVIGDKVYVWYTGKTSYDAPFNITEDGKVLAVNGFQDYFYIIQNDKNINEEGLDEIASLLGRWTKV